MVSLLFAVANRLFLGCQSKIIDSIVTESTEKNFHRFHWPNSQNLGLVWPDCTASGVAAASCPCSLPILELDGEIF